jgi:hypothetical protein
MVDSVLGGGGENKPKNEYMQMQIRTLGEPPSECVLTPCLTPNLLNLKKCSGQTGLEKFLKMANLT